MSEAFRSGLESIYPDLKRFALNLVRDMSSAEDLMQETVLTALRAASLFEEGTNLKGWTYSIMRNIHRNAYRKAASRRRYESHDSDADSPVEATQMLSMDVGDAQRAINALPEDQRTTIYLMVYDGLSYEEAAEVLDVKAGTVRSRLSRARETLRLTLGEDRPRIGRLPEPAPGPR